MPYIKLVDRENYLQLFHVLDAMTIMQVKEFTAGDLNFLISKLCKQYIKKNKESYKTYNDIIGALECAKLELYRRKISAYEDKKIKENGDIY